MNDLDIKPGWCCFWARCGGVAVECVVGGGRAELCLPCVAAELGLPADAPGGAIVTELLRREVAA